MSEDLLQKIGPYNVRSRLGAGGMGTVYHAVHSTTGAEVAVKVLPASMAREPGFVARFEREIEALRKLASPQIVALYDSGVDGETYYYAMEYVHGETLTDRLERVKRIPWREAIDIAVQICRALKAAHNAGVIHRDLKPSNLMITADGTVKLTDFGVAQMFAGGKLTATGGIIGTAEYMSPEQAQGKRASRQSDIYALGAVLYVMLTGRPPFTGKTPLDIAQKHQYGQFDSPKRVVPEIPQWLDEVVCQCLSKKPEDRYPDAYVLSLRLQEIPRKIDLAAGGKEVIDVDGASGSAETLATNTNAVAAANAGIGGTFVRDMLRAELEQAAAQTPLERLLDNTWVLVTLLVLFLAAGVWFFRTRQVDPQAQFDAGAKLMESADRADWIAAGEDYFRPLRESDPETWGPRIDPYTARIQLAEAERDLVRLAARRGRQDVVGSEVVQLLQGAARGLQRGESAGPRRQLEALRQLLEQTQGSETELAIVQNVLEKLPPTPETVELPLLRSALAQAEALRQAGKVAEARRIWSAIVTLYREDAAALDQVQAAEAALRDTSSAAAPAPAAAPTP